MPSYLKSLELQGYKTFAAPTVFEFAGSITAIVGPNGSGKSNIADALRWVLGEQSYSLLRGKKTEDMIFAGSEQRQRAGMALAAVIFDNSDNWLPIDFSEVAVARRAYRDGQNEYLLNGQRVRLKDVSELLAESGLAERTYTIIGQGLVDAALALKAEERRRLFEEAAGIGLHRSRREEALRRLDATRRNLERVQDILSELSPRLRSLERQATRAEEYERVKADLRQVLRVWHGYHWHRAQKGLREAREVVRRREIALQSARQAQANYHQKLKTLRNRIQRLRDELGKYHRRMSQLHNQREDLTRRIAVNESRLRSLEEQRETIQSDMVQAEEEIGIQKTRLDHVIQEVARLEKGLSEAAGHYEVAQRALRSQQVERDQAETQLQSVQQELTRLNNHKSQIVIRLGERRAQIEKLKSSLEEISNLLEETRGRLRSAERKLQDSKNIMETAERQRVEAESALNARREQLSQSESKRKEIVNQLASLQTEMARMVAQQEVIEQAERSLDGYATGARILLQAARQEKFGGAHTTLGNIIEVPAELETPISAALGEFLESILLERITNLDEALEILKSHSARGALIPLDSISFPAHLELDGNVPDDVIGVAAQLVTAPAQIRPAVDLLLGQVLVVRDREAARRALDRLRSERGLKGSLPTIRVVTLSGEVFHIGGHILAGGDSKPTILSRTRQKRELAQALEKAEQRVTLLESQLSDLEENFTELQTHCATLARSHADKVEEEEKGRLSYRQQALALEQIKREVNWQQERRQNAQSDIDSGEAEILQMQEDLLRSQEELSQLEKDAQDKTAALADLDLEEFRSRVSHWETQEAVAIRAFEDGKARLGDREAALHNVEQMLDTYQSRMTEIEAEEEKLRQEVALLRQSEIEIDEQIEVVNAHIHPREEKLAIAERERDKLLNSEGEAQQELNQAEHQNAQARIDLARRQEILDSLRRRIEDDFGLVEFEYEEDVSGPTPLPFQGLVEKLPLVKHLPSEVEETLKSQRAHLRRMGPVNPEASREYQEVKERFQFLTNQVEDLEKAEVDIRRVINELDSLMEREFYKTFEQVAEEFRQIFNRLFGGGSARLVLSDPDDLTNTGIDIEARLPGQREQGLSLLSGGERSLTATALVFALLRVSPTPFCVLDEVDAMLDETNVGKFRDLLRELSQTTQFIIITHNRNTVQVADVIYGVTMGRDSTSQVISLKLDEVSEVVA